MPVPPVSGQKVLVFRVIINTLQARIERQAREYPQVREGGKKEEEKKLHVSIFLSPRPFLSPPLCPRNDGAVVIYLFYIVPPTFLSDLKIPVFFPPSPSRLTPGSEL